MRRLDRRDPGEAPECQPSHSRAQRPDPSTATPFQPEAREETIERIQSDEMGAESQHEPGGGDPTARRHLGRRGLLKGHMVGGVAAIVAALVIFLIGGSLALSIGIGAAVLIGTGVIVAIVMAEGEDGKIERQVERVDDEQHSS